MLDYELKNLCFSYNKHKDYIFLNTEFYASRGKITAVTGANGNGKSTLLYIMSGILLPQENSEYLVLGKKIELSPKSVDMFRKEQVGLMLQKYALINDKTVYENVCLPLKVVGRYDDPYVWSVLEKLQIADYYDSYPKELSGGQQQRVAFARSIIKRPKLILLDEPISAFDDKGVNVFMDILVELKKNAAIVVTNHDKRIDEICDVKWEINDRKQIIRKK